MSVPDFLRELTLINANILTQRRKAQMYLPQRRRGHRGNSATSVALWLNPEMIISPTGVNRVYIVDNQKLKGQHKGQHFWNGVYNIGNQRLKGQHSFFLRQNRYNSQAKVQRRCTIKIEKHFLLALFRAKAQGRGI